MSALQVVSQELADAADQVVDESGDDREQGDGAEEEDDAEDDADDSFAVGEPFLGEFVLTAHHLAHAGGDEDDEQEDGAERHDAGDDLSGWCAEQVSDGFVVGFLQIGVCG